MSLATAWICCRPLTSQVDWSQKRKGSGTVLRCLLIVDVNSTTQVRPTTIRTRVDADRVNRLGRPGSNFLWQLLPVDPSQEPAWRNGRR